MGVRVILNPHIYLIIKNHKNMIQFGDTHDQNQEDILAQVESLDLNLKQAISLYMILDKSLNYLNRELNWLKGLSQEDIKNIELRNKGFKVEEEVMILSDLLEQRKTIQINLKETILLLDGGDIIFKPKK
jgi:hypothetical protein